MGGIAGALLAIVLPVLAATTWGMFVAPKAKSRLSYPRRALIEAAIFGAACIALFAAELIVLAIAFLVVEAANTVIRSLLGQLDA